MNDSPDPDAVDDLEIEELEAELAYELEAEATRPPKPRRWWAWPGRLAISAVMLWYLVHKIADVSFADLVPTWTAATFAWIGVAVVLTVFSIVLSAGRWQQVLVGMDVRVRFNRLLSHYFAGQFVSNVLPTTIGGDVLRVSRLSTDTGDTADSFASVIIERLTGWVVLPVLTFAGLALDPAVRTLDVARIAMLIAIGTLGTLAAILFMADHPRLGGRFASRDGWRRFIGAVHLGVAKLRRHRLAIARVLGVGIAYQFTLVLAGYAVALALGLGDQITLTVMLAFLPAVLILQVLPIGIGGLGVREDALVLFLAPLGVSQASAVALGLMLFGVNLLASLAGAPAFLSGSRTRRS